MRRLRVGVVLSLSEELGGGFVQASHVANLFRAAAGSAHDVEFVATDRAGAEELRKVGISVDHSSGPVLRLVTRWLASLPRTRLLLRRIYRRFPGRGSLDAMARKRGYDLLVFTNSTRQIRGVKTTPFICSVWDVCHRDHPEFPDLRIDSGFEWREDFFRNVLPRASAYIVESDWTTQRLVNYYGLDPSRAIVVPLAPSPGVLSADVATTDEVQQLRTRFGLARPFLYYPAQFWAHKNHIYILRALKILAETEGITVDAVFSGSDRGNLSHVLNTAERLGVRDQIKYVGFLPARDCATLYREAAALVMPAYYGPTNIPPLEARALGCTVIYSDEPGFRDFAGPEALYCDLTDPGHLAGCIQAALARPRPAPVPHHQSDEARVAIRQTLQRLAAKFDSWQAWSAGTPE